MSDFPSDQDRLTTLGDVDSSATRSIEAMLHDGTLGSAWHAEQTSSTNSIALQAIREPGLAPPITPRLFLADLQTAGRGRHGRTWQSDCSSMTLSILLPWEPGTNPQSRLIPLAVGVGIARVIEFELAPVKVSLKWPNDVRCAGGKLAGVLLEASASLDFVVIGVGLNIETAPDLSLQSGAQPTTSVAKIAGRRISRYDLLQPIVAGILDTIGMLADDSVTVVDEFRSRCVLSGKSISFDDGGQRSIGQCVGIDSDGSLLVEVNGELRRIQSGEARLLRIQN
ncbi:Bifunctional ligase/repressor BirA [Rubripirellula lacrimiformis]|uniref:biotin--[biotin carboxyl-carrier protein] ligase n=1 Tax=Rubripirellula lacrimiformis TaxID=1930273 RepID=A0A517N9W6_9BACT|nr:biotin--[acetyl-CoA-carboxylase] ligase [Rubripirellula lacrimiformis]QDT03922.1 Bifunctional ligase/repressor BirA [Rubripirellula lacrimiformis]